MYKRLLEAEFLAWMKREEILILTGSRQVGKSTFLKDIQSRMSETTVFYNLEDLDLLNLFDENPKNLPKLLRENFPKWEKIYVFLDEIQYLADPTRFLKYIYDEHKDGIKLIVSGSSAFYMDEKFRDSLAGRKKIFHMAPLCFKEFLIFKNEERLVESLANFSQLTTVTQSRINDHLDEFLTFGGYPKVVLEGDFEVKKELLWELLNSFVKKDILESKVELPGKFLQLYKLISSQTGNLLNANELSNTLDLSTTAVNRYIHVLEKTFHISELRPFHTNIRKELTKMPKVYIQDLWIKNYFEKNFNRLSDRVDFGAIFETFVYNELRYIHGEDALNYWRTKDKKEIDFILRNGSRNEAIEVKYTDQKVNFEVFSGEYPGFSTKVVSRKNVFGML